MTGNIFQKKKYFIKFNYIKNNWVTKEKWNNFNEKNEFFVLGHKINNNLI